MSLLFRSHKNLGLAFLLVWALAFLFSAASVQAQRPNPRDLPREPPPPMPRPTPKEPSDKDYEVVRTTSNLIVVPVSVTDSAGQPVLGLTKEIFRLEEEGRTQEIAQIGDPEQVPLDIVILFDASSSVTQKNFFTFQQQAAVRFLKQVMKPVDRAAVFVIADKPQLVQPLAPAETAFKMLLAIPAATVPTPTAFYDSVTTAAKYLAQNAPSQHRRVIVALSDGDDNFSTQIRDMSVAEARLAAKGEQTPAESRRLLQERHRRAVLDVEREVQRDDAVFYSINSGGPSVRLNEISTRAQAGMQQLAETTGGNSFVPDKIENLDAVFQQIAAELRSQYLLQYYANSDAPPEKFLRIKVTIPTRPELRIRARQGYYPKRGK